MGIDSLLTGSLSSSSLISNLSSDLPSQFGAVPQSTISTLSGLSSGTSTAAASTTAEKPITVTAPVLWDDRVRLQAISGKEVAIYGAKDTSNVMNILHTTGGMLFPFTPTINVAQTVNWDPVALVQTNFDINTYQRTPSVSISVSGIFTAQTQREGEYCLAVIHFLRTVSKSHFGAQDKNAGTPPPVLVFNGYGDYMFNRLRCVLKSHSYVLDDSVDSNTFTLAGGLTARLPSKFQISLELGVQQTPAKQRDDFNLEDFRTGKLMQQSGGWY